MRHLNKIRETNGGQNLKGARFCIGVSQDMCMNLIRTISYINSYFFSAVLRHAFLNENNKRPTGRQFRGSVPYSQMHNPFVNCQQLLNQNRHDWSVYQGLSGIPNT